MNDLASVRVAFGPAMPGIGSWDWIGADLSKALSSTFAVTTFDKGVVDCDIAVIVKYLPANELLETLTQRCRVIYLPVDFFGSAAEIDLHLPFLRRCARVVVHSPSLRKYFQSYTPVESIDHHVKYVSAMKKAYAARGPVLWVGMRNNLGPLLDYLSETPLQEPLHVLTNLETETADPSELGFDPSMDVTVEKWSATRHVELVRQARAAIDIKGEDFRQQHKPAAKAIDFVASGLPLAMNLSSSSARYLRSLGFEIAPPDAPDRWLSKAYWQETRRFGRALREFMSLERIALRFSDIVRRVWEESR